MNGDDPIALLRALDPADEKHVDEVVGRLAAAGTPIRAVVQRPRGHGWRGRRVAWLLVATAATALLLGALIANPFSRSGTISAAEAKAQVARALDLEGNWHVEQTLQSTIAPPTAIPHFAQTSTTDTWHAGDGRLLVRSSGAGESVTSLYANGGARIYDSRRQQLTIRRFATPADMRDQERSYLPSSAAALYRAAFRIGKVRFAGSEKLHGRRVYRLAFDWLGSSYTLVFDADRRVPISSESRMPNVNGDQVLITRVIYTAYETVKSGPGLDRHLQLPAIPGGTKTTREEPLLIPAPVQGASAARAMRLIVSRSAGGFGASVSLSRARWVIVHRFRGGGIFAGAILPALAPGGAACYAYLEIAHPGGAAREANAGCPSGIGMTPSQDGLRMLVSGFTQATGIALRFANGVVVHPALRDGVVVATPPIGLFRYAATVVKTYPHGVVRREPLESFVLGAIPGWLAR
jgi:hypothetical protein